MTGLVSLTEAGSVDILGGTWFLGNEMRPVRETRE